MNKITFTEIEESSLSILASILNYYVANTTVTFHTVPLTATDMREKVFFDRPSFNLF